MVAKTPQSRYHFINMNIKKIFYGVSPRPGCLYLLLLSLTFICCRYSYHITVNPPDAPVRVNDELQTNPVTYKTRYKVLYLNVVKEGYSDYTGMHRHTDFFKAKELTVNLERLSYPVSLEVMDEPSAFVIDDTIRGMTPAEVTLDYGSHTLILKRAEYDDQTIPLQISAPGSFTFRHQLHDPGLQPVGVFSCGRQPKQLLFSPDDKYIFITLLDDYGFQVFDVAKQQIVTMVVADETKKYKGFVEGLFIPRHNAFLVSQMRSGKIYEYTIAEKPELKRIIPSGGAWPKVIAYSGVLDKLAISNWASSSVCIVDYASGRVEYTIRALDTPRGAAFTHDGRYLIVASFDGGYIWKFSTTDWQEVAKIHKRSAAMRHVVIADDDSRCWVSNMYHPEVHEIELAGFTMTKSYRIFDKANTIELSPDNRYLFVSCRGPNNPRSYLLRSPENGQVKVIDLLKQEVTATIYGGNQCTGLDVSHDGRHLCFSNFLDRNFEIYDLTRLP